MNKSKNKKIILLGDFNTTDIGQYEDKIVRQNILKFIFNDNRYQMNNNIIKSLSKQNFKSSTKELKYKFNSLEWYTK